MKKLKNTFFKNLNFIQNFLIIFLCGTVLIEVSHLWFVNLSNGQSILVKQNESVAKPIYKMDFVSPKKVLNSIGNNNFYIVYEGEAYDEIISIINSILIESATSSEFIEEGNNIDDILDNEKLIIFDYDYKISSPMLLEALNINKNNYSRLNEFNKIFFVIENNQIDIYFADTTLDIYYKYELTNMTLANNLQVSSKKILSASTYSYNLVKDNYIFESELIANLETPFYYNTVVANNPFVTIYGESPRSLVESKVDKYFDNIPYNTPSETAYIFSDTDTVVKYFNSGILEYSYYDITSNSYEYSIVEDFAIAKDFIEKDEDVINKYYLKEYYRNNFETVFEFGYIVNNFPVRHEDNEGLSEISISITVKNNVVINYRKNVNSYEVMQTVEKASKTLEEALSVLSITENDPKVTNVILGYKSNNDSEIMTLYWFMEAFGNGTSFSTN